MFKEELEDLKNRYLSRLTLHHRVLAGGDRPAAQQRARSAAPRSASSSRTLVDAGDIDHAFVCGPHGVNDEAEAALLAAGVARRAHPHRALRHPRRTGPGARAPCRRRARATPPTRAVTIVRDGVSREIDFHAEQGNMLDAAAAAGLEVPFSCKSGVCCTCRAKLLEGEVRMERNFALEKHEVAAGFVLTCQAHPLTERVVLSFDER